MLNKVRANLTVLFGSQTGNSEDVAERIVRKARRLGILANACDLNDYLIPHLIEENVVVFVCSTTGQGEFPDTMKRFWKFLLRKQLPLDSLSQINFCVIGLGDSSYERYNVVAKKLSKRLVQLGGKELLPLTLGDDQHELGYDAALDSWIQSFFPKLSELFPSVSDFETISEEVLLPPKYIVRFITEENKNASLNMAQSNINGDTSYVTLRQNEKITAVDHFQAVNKIVFDLLDTNIQYQPGDVAVLQPQNHPDKVNDFLELLNIPIDDPFVLEPSESNVMLPTGLSSILSVRRCATSYWDIQSIPRRSFFELLWYFSQSDLEREKLQEFTTAEGQEELYSYCNRPRRTILEVLQDFPNTTPHIPLAYLFDLLPCIRPRSFSIASSLSYHPHEVHLIVAIVKYKTLLQKPREGLCSTWLSMLDFNCNLRIPLSVKKGSISLPPDSVPLIAVGPGTGVAPFRGFIQERFCRGIKENYLFFGCRNKCGDFLCKEDWQFFVDEGFLKLFVAFSRDQDDKIYVQHRMLEQDRLLWDLIDLQGAWIYIAGSAKQMPQDVKTALLTIIQEHGVLSSDDSKKYLENLELQKRLQIEAWS